MISRSRKRKHGTNGTNGNKGNNGNNGNNRLRVMSSKRQTLEMLSTMEGKFLDRPTKDSLGEIRALLIKNGKEALAREYLKSYNESLQLEEEALVAAAEEAAAAAEAAAHGRFIESLGRLGEKYAEKNSLKQRLITFFRGIRANYFPQTPQPTVAEPLVFTRGLDYCQTWIEASAEWLRANAATLYAILESGDSEAVFSILETMSRKARQCATLLKIWATGIPPALLGFIGTICSTLGKFICELAIYAIYEPSSPFVLAAYEKLGEFLTYVLGALLSNVTGGFMGDAAAGNDLAAGVLLILVSYKLYVDKYGSPGSGSGVGYRLDALKTNMIRISSSFYSWVGTIPGGVYNSYITVRRFLATSPTARAVSAGFNTSVHILTGLPLRAIAAIFVGFRDKLGQLKAELLRVFEAGAAAEAAEAEAEAEAAKAEAEAAKAAAEAAKAAADLAAADLAAVGQELLQAARILSEEERAKIEEGLGAGLTELEAEVAALRTGGARRLSKGKKNKKEKSKKGNNYKIKTKVGGKLNVKGKKKTKGRKNKNPLNSKKNNKKNKN